MDKAASDDQEAGARSLTSLAFEQLRTDIINGTLRPAERLRIQHLAQRYEKGPTAIREALSRLVTDGLVESEDQRGFCVAPASIEELMDLSQTRSWVEHAALCMAIQNGDVDWESTVLASFHRLSRLQDPTAAPHAAPVWRAAHREFHLSLVQGCKSPWTVKLCAMLFDQTERYRNLAGRAPRIRERDVLGEHKRLMEAVLSRNTELATQILAAHFKHTTDLILEGGLLSSAPRRSAARRG